MKLEYVDKIKSKYKGENGDITFYDTELNTTQLIKIEKHILNKGDYKEAIFNNMNIIDFGSNLFFLEVDKSDIEKYKKLFIDNFEQDGYFAKGLKNERHSPKYKGYFEFKQKTYIMVDGVNKLTNEIDSEKGVYKGVIVNPELYFGKVENQVDSIEDKVKDIL